MTGSERSLAAARAVVLEVVLAPTWARSVAVVLAAVLAEALTVPLVILWRRRADR